MSNVVYIAVLEFSSSVLYTDRNKGSDVWSEGKYLRVQLTYQGSATRGSDDDEGKYLSEFRLV